MVGKGDKPIIREEVTSVELSNDAPHDKSIFYMPASGQIVVLRRNVYQGRALEPSVYLG